MEQLTGMIFPLLILGVFYFFMIRPQLNKQKKQQKFIDNIQKGDEVVTSSGIIGRINKIEGSIVTIQVDPKTFMRFTKGSINEEMTNSLASLLEPAEAEKS